MPTKPVKRIIEVDLPIKRISAHARREKSIRHGHISTLHVWWARRPVAACRAVICAALWPDPAHDDCPTEFVKAATEQMLRWTDHEHLVLLSEESRPRFEGARRSQTQFDDRLELRQALLDFIADFADWENCNKTEFLRTSRALTCAAHAAMGGAAETRPLVVDPFAGGGSIPLEALRIGADTFASDLNSIPVLLNKVILEYIPQFGRRLSDEVKLQGDWVKQEAARILSDLYPEETKGTKPVAYLWARTIRCEGPGCGVEIPLIRSLWLAKKTNRSVALHVQAQQNPKDIRLKIIVKGRSGWANQDDPSELVPEPKFEGTIRRGAVTCPCCGYATPTQRIRAQLKPRKAGTGDARLLCVVQEKHGETGVIYKLPTPLQEAAIQSAKQRLTSMTELTGGLAPIPNEPFPDETASGALSASVLYGFGTWGDLFPPRAAVSLAVFSKLVCSVEKRIEDRALAVATTTCLAFCVSKLADYLSSLCVWRTARSCAAHTFGRQALPMTWDFAEMNPFAGSAGDWQEAVRYLGLFIEENSFPGVGQGTAARGSATEHSLPDDSAQLICTDPPYYDAIAYADLSDFFYVWLRRILGGAYPTLFGSSLSHKDDEIVQLSKRFPGKYAHKTKAFFEERMTLALGEARRVVQPQGIGVIVFAHKSTSGWEAMLQSLIDAGWIVTGSWAIDTERGGRLNSNDAASLASSVHIVCRPRETPDGKTVSNEVGDWRDVLQELPKRIHEWMPRLAKEGVVGADAIFACLGPALEIFSKFSRVEKASGELVSLREYLEQVWAAVSREALSSLISGSDLSSFESDARITAMWLWTMSAGSSSDDETNDSDDSDSEDASTKVAAKSGYTLDSDTARKIVQGLGAAPEELSSIISIEGEYARLLPVADRTNYLFGKKAEPSHSGATRAKAKKTAQLNLFAELGGESSASSDEVWAEKAVTKPGATVLDRVHQSMVLFATGRGDALRGFLVDDGAGQDQSFWKLAQALSALYPASSQEKRWVDGVLARKKGLGL